jgi:hypothetical protein
MTQECIDLLCTRIKDNVGEGPFKSEAYLRDLLGDLAPPDFGINVSTKETCKGYLYSIWWIYLWGSEAHDYIVYACRGVLFGSRPYPWHWCIISI